MGYLTKAGVWIKYGPPSKLPPPPQDDVPSSLPSSSSWEFPSLATAVAISPKAAWKAKFSRQERGGRSRRGGRGNGNKNFKKGKETITIIDEINFTKLVIEVAEFVLDESSSFPRWI